MVKKKFAVIGDPISHSLSPQMHNSAFRALGLDAEYSAIRVKPLEIPQFAIEARRELAGFNVTVPHKFSIIPYIDECSKNACNSQSVNTVTNSDGRLLGESTDGYGLATAISESFGIKLKGESFLFLGAGGAAHATAFYFIASGLSKLFFVNRTTANAQELVASLQSKFPGATLDCCGIDDESRIHDFCSKVSVVVQTTSLGLKDSDPSPLPQKFFTKDTCYYDMIYKRTKFLKYASSKGCRFADGRSMLLHQGAESFRIWTGLPAPVEEMRKAIWKD